MKVLDTLTLAAAGATDSLRFDAYPDKMQCRGVRLRVSIPLKNSTAGALTPTAADVRNACAKLSGVTLSYGPSNEFVPYAACPGEELFDVYQALHEDQIQTDMISAGSIASGVTATRKISLFIPFYLEKWTGRQRLPGVSQMRTFKVEVVRHSSDNITAATWDLNGTITIDVIPVTQVGPDQWAPVASYARVNQARLEAELPAGLPIMVWDLNSTTAATALTRFFAYVGEKEFHTNIRPSDVQDEYSRELDQGGVDVTASTGGGGVTLLYTAPKFSDLDTLPHGAFKFRQNSQDLATIKLRGIYLPDMPHLGETAAKEASKQRNEPVLASVTDAPHYASPSANNTGPIRIFRANDSGFTGRVGKLGTPGGHVMDSVPPSVVARVGAAASLGGDAVERKALATAAQKAAVAQMPGAISTTGKGRGPGRTAVRAANRRHFE